MEALTFPLHPVNRNHLILCCVAAGIMAFIVSHAATNTKRDIRYEQNRWMYLQIAQDELQCLQRSVSASYRYTDGMNDTEARDLLRGIVSDCNNGAFDRLRFRDSPETFYTWTIGKEPDIFYDFTGCTFSLASPMWDFPPGVTLDKFRDSVIDCTRKFPTLAQLRA